jgi:hypothetical protein
VGDEVMKSTLLFYFFDNVGNLSKEEHFGLAFR